jgi:hypothetical protein
MIDFGPHRHKPVRIRKTMTPNLKGPPGCTRICERDWLHFLWLFHCCSVQRAKDFLWQHQVKPSEVKLYAEHARLLPEDWQDRLANEIAARIINNDRSLDPPRWREDTARHDLSRQNAE